MSSYIALDKFDKICYGMFYEQLQLNKFENFIYQKSSERYFDADDYLTLISINYRLNLSRYKVIKVLERYADFGKLEAFRVVAILKNALNNDINLGKYLIDIYELYCDGYSFLETIALRYGLICTYTSKDYEGETWYELSNTDKQRFHDMLLPNLNEHLVKAINWIKDGKVKFTGEKNEINQWEYVDLRVRKDKDNTSK